MTPPEPSRRTLEATTHGQLAAWALMKRVAPKTPVGGRGEALRDGRVREDGRISRVICVVFFSRPVKLARSCNGCLGVIR